MYPCSYYFKSENNSYTSKFTQIRLIFRFLNRFLFHEGTRTLLNSVKSRLLGDRPWVGFRIKAILTSRQPPEKLQCLYENLCRILSVKHLFLKNV